MPQLSRLPHVVSTKAALEYAKQVIASYEADIRNSEWVGVDLEKAGFCQGLVYKWALDHIAELERRP